MRNVLLFTLLAIFAFAPVPARADTIEYDLNMDQCTGSCGLTAPLFETITLTDTVANTGPLPVYSNTNYGFTGNAFSPAVPSYAPVYSNTNDAYDNNYFPATDPWAGNSYLNGFAGNAFSPAVPSYAPVYSNTNYAYANNYYFPAAFPWAVNSYLNDAFGQNSFFPVYAPTVYSYMNGPYYANGFPSMFGSDLAWQSDLPSNWLPWSAPTYSSGDLLSDWSSVKGGSQTQSDPPAPAPTTSNFVSVEVSRAATSDLKPPAVVVQTPEPQFSIADTPEPGSFGLLAGGLLMFAWIFWKRSKRTTPRVNS